MTSPRAREVPASAAPGPLSVRPTHIVLPAAYAALGVPPQPCASTKAASASFAMAATEALKPAACVE